MEQFVTINNTIINKNQIKSINVERDVEPTDDYEYPNSLRTTDIYLIIDTLEGTKEFIILDNDFLDFINFIQEFYCTDYEHARKQAVKLINKAPIRKSN